MKIKYAERRYSSSSLSSEGSALNINIDNQFNGQRQESANKVDEVLIDIAKANGSSEDHVPQEEFLNVFNNGPAPETPVIVNIDLDTPSINQGSHQIDNFQQVSALRTQHSPQPQTIATEPANISPKIGTQLMSGPRFQVNKNQAIINQGLKDKYQIKEPSPREKYKQPPLAPKREGGMVGVPYMQKRKTSRSWSRSNKPKQLNSKFFEQSKQAQYDQNDGIYIAEKKESVIQKNEVQWPTSQIMQTPPAQNEGLMNNIYTIEEKTNDQTQNQLYPDSEDQDLAKLDKNQLEKRIQQMKLEIGAFNASQSARDNQHVKFEKIVPLEEQRNARKTQKKKVLVEKKASEKQSSPRRFANVPGPGGGGGSNIKQVRPSSPPTDPFVHAKSKTKEKRITMKQRQNKKAASPSTLSSQSPPQSIDRQRNQRSGSRKRQTSPNHQALQQQFLMYQQQQALQLQSLQNQQMPLPILQNHNKDQQSQQIWNQFMANQQIQQQQLQQILQYQNKQDSNRNLLQSRQFSTPEPQNPFASPTVNQSPSQFRPSHFGPSQEFSASSSNLMAKLEGPDKSQNQLVSDLKQKVQEQQDQLKQYRKMEDKCLDLEQQVKEKDKVIQEMGSMNANPAAFEKNKSQLDLKIRENFSLKQSVDIQKQELDKIKKKQNGMEDQYNAKLFELETAQNDLQFTKQQLHQKVKQEQLQALNVSALQNRVSELERGLEIRKSGINQQSINQNVEIQKFSPIAGVSSFSPQRQNRRGFSSSVASEQEAFGARTGSQDRNRWWNASGISLGQDVNTKYVSTAKEAYGIQQYKQPKENYWPSKQGMHSRQASLDELNDPSKLINV